MQLWLDMPQYKSPKNKRHSPEYDKTLRQERCINLTGEGGFSNACKALYIPPPLGHTAEVAARLTEKHPSAQSPVDLSEFGNASCALVPPS